MPKYRVWLPEQEQIIEAESEDEAQEIFQDSDGIFDFLEVEEAKEPAPETVTIRTYPTVDHRRNR
jgi:hypothetical protein